jgi:hypothetical protein
MVFCEAGVLSLTLSALPSTVQGRAEILPSGAAFALPLRTSLQKLYLSFTAGALRGVLGGDRPDAGFHDGVNFAQTAF